MKQITISLVHFRSVLRHHSQDLICINGSDAHLLSNEYSRSDGESEVDWPCISLNIHRLEKCLVT